MQWASENRLIRDSEASHAGELLEVLSAHILGRCHRVVGRTPVASGLQAGPRADPGRAGPGGRVLLRQCRCAFTVLEAGFQHDATGRGYAGRLDEPVPRCRTDLTKNVRGHFSSCVTLPSEIKQRAREVREAAQILIKRSQELSDRSDVLIREAEARLFESQRALRRAMSRSKTS